MAKEIPALTPEAKVVAEIWIEQTQKFVRDTFYDKEEAERALESMRDTASLICLYSGRDAAEIYQTIHAALLYYMTGGVDDKIRAGEAS